MPKKTPPADGLRWLDRLEAGETEAAIAKKLRKDLRTVRGAIERARRHRDMNAVQRDALLNAFSRHQAQPPPPPMNR